MRPDAHAVRCRNFIQTPIISNVAKRKPSLDAYVTTATFGRCIGSSRCVLPRADVNQHLEMPPSDVDRVHRVYKRARCVWSRLSLVVDIVEYTHTHIHTRISASAQVRVRTQQRAAKSHLSSRPPDTAAAARRRRSRRRANHVRRWNVVESDDRPVYEGRPTAV